MNPVLSHTERPSLFLTHLARSLTFNNGRRPKERKAHRGAGRRRGQRKDRKAQLGRRCRALIQQAKYTETQLWVGQKYRDLNESFEVLTFVWKSKVYQDKACSRKLTVISEQKALMDDRRENLRQQGKWAVGYTTILLRCLFFLLFGFCLWGVAIIYILHNCRIITRWNIWKNIERINSWLLT